MDNNEPVNVLMVGYTSERTESPEITGLEHHWT